MAVAQMSRAKRLRKDCIDETLLLETLIKVKNGVLSARMPANETGLPGKVFDALNDVVEMNQRLVQELERVSTVVGKEGRIKEHASLPNAAGSWKTCMDCINTLIGDLVRPTTEVARVIGAVAKGDLSQTMALEIDGRPLTGEFLRTAQTVNTMVEQLSTFTSEVIRVAREVGTEGKLGGQAQVKGVSGTWKDLTDSVNSMASNLTSQVRNIAEVTIAVANGDLSKKITVDVRGEFLQLKETINTMVDQLRSFASEVTRVAREVGTEGKLGGQAQVMGVAGTWRDLTENVNSMAGNLTAQVRYIAAVTTAVATGDLSKKITVDAKGEILELKNTVNNMVDQLNAFAAEVTRVAREVGTEGALGGQAQVKGVSGTWKDLTDSVNLMASNLTSQVRNIAEVTTAVATGDLSKRITVDVRGEFLQLKETINTMVDQLNGFAAEVTRVAREVGTEGKLGGQAQVRGVSGTWKDLTDSVNSMASNLTSQVRNIATVTTAVATGDLSKKITVDAKGEILELKNTVNTMVDQLNAFAAEVTRVAREVGTEGKLGGQAAVGGVSGTWRDLTDSVNSMASNLTAQVRNIAAVTTAVATGDLSKKITVDAKGEILELKNTINNMVDQLNAFAAEVTRVAREVGTEGKLGGQAKVMGVAGTWRDLTENVNLMASNLTSQVRNIAEVTIAVANGDMSKKITVDVRGEFLQLKETINTMVDQLRAFAAEVTRVAREVGTEGRLGGQAYVPGVSGTWKDLTDSVNSMASNLTDQVRNIAAVTTAVASGDLNKKITVDVKGEILELKNTINNMVDQLNAFAAEVTRVAREVGTEGKLGGQAQVRGVSGTWKDLTDNVNMMAANLTSQVRGVAQVVTAVANGNLKRKLTVEAKGEVAQLVDTINDMTDTLATFADQVTTVAREVGVQGRLGGQAKVPGVAGIWKDLVDNVNGLAANLTTQVRAIAEVATAVTKGDLSRSITVEAAGEVAALKDRMNEMIGNLRDTTRTNTEQDWLKTNLANITRVLQGERDLLTVSKRVLSELAPVVTVQHGVFYINERNEDKPSLRLLSSYGYTKRKQLATRFFEGEALVGQALFEKKPILLTDVPDDYVAISSGLGERKPINIVVLPVLFEGEVLAALELSSFQQFSEIHLAFLGQLTESLGIVLNTITATSRTEALLKQSQSLAVELQTQQSELTETNKRLEEQARTLQASEDRLRQQQDELQEANEKLADRASMLSMQKEEMERKNREVEQARILLLEKAEQLELTSKYKSEFLANMSHELRTPLNSMLILSRILAENPETNLNEKQVEYAQAINTAGSDLLTLINDILDIAKIESGAVEVDAAETNLTELMAAVDTTFRPLAESKKLGYSIIREPSVPPTMYTDAKRLQQVLKNLLSNAFKFTEHGDVSLRIGRATSGWSTDHTLLNHADMVIAFSVTDTGIGIPADKQKVIFEAFQQADASTVRKYGGTGLGLAISREITNLLGGELRLTFSQPEEGSVFTVYLPHEYARRYTARNSSRTSDDGAKRVANEDSVLNNPDQFEGVKLAEGNGDAAARATANSHADDRDQIKPEDRIVLVVEDDPPLAQLILDEAHRRGFKGIIATEGESALNMARKFRPDLITLDILMPGMSGWALLDLLKHYPDTRHIPVCVITVLEQRSRALRSGAFGFLQKPVTPAILSKTFDGLVGFIDKRRKSLLVVERAVGSENAVSEILRSENVEMVASSSGQAALAALSANRFDALVLGQEIDDMSTAALLDQIRERPALADMPIVAFVPGGLAPEHQIKFTSLGELLVIDPVTTREELLNRVALRLHEPEAQLPAKHRKILELSRYRDPILAGRKVLVVDDDVRNVFALTSLLERHKMQVKYATGGKAAIEILQESPDIALVLMDVMMPDMDGYQTMQAIRSMAQFHSLPIIALTAKAMKGDRAKCLEAGASDYIPKPADPDRLLSLVRVWLYSAGDRSPRSGGALVAA